jgi:acyl-CoA synthetase (AMP-forming)/AMP-acid ligase II
VIVDDQGGRVTAQELRDGAEALAGALVARGVEPGDTVSWILPSVASTAVLCAALARLGAVQNPLVPIYGDRELAFITGQAGTRLLVTPGTFRGVDFSEMGRAAGVEVAEVVALSDCADMALPSAPTDIDAVRWLFYTSGTTSEPKGVRHSDRSLIAGAFAMRDNGVRPGGRWGGAFPFGHIGGPSILALALDIEMTLHFAVVFDPVATCAFLRDHDVDAVVGIGALVNAMLAEQRVDPSRRAFPALRVLLAGGGPKLPGLSIAVREELGAEIGCSYGMTEMPIVSSANPFGEPRPLDVGEGRATPGVEIRIVGDDGHALGRGEEGEVRVKGPQLFHGYADVRLNEGAFDDEGFFRSGDVAYLAPEGDLVITGRIKDVIIRNGENLSVREIEDLLLGHRRCHRGGRARRGHG